MQSSYHVNLPSLNHENTGQLYSQEEGEIDAGMGLKLEFLLSSLLVVASFKRDRKTRHLVS